MTKNTTTTGKRPGRRERAEREKARMRAALGFTGATTVSAIPVGRGLAVCLSLPGGDSRRLRLELTATGPAKRPVLTAVAGWGGNVHPVDMDDAFLALGILPPWRPSRRKGGGGLSRIDTKGKRDPSPTWTDEGCADGRRDLVAEAWIDFFDSEADAGIMRHLVGTAAFALIELRSPAWAERLVREAARLERARKAAVRVQR